MKKLILLFTIACFTLMLNSCITAEVFRGPHEYYVRYGEVVLLPYGMRISRVYNYRNRLGYDIVPMESNYIPMERTYCGRNGRRSIIRERR